jgi:outer membrane protein TolC
MTASTRPYVFALIALALAAGLSGCAANPKLKKPAANFPVAPPQTAPAPIPASTTQRLDTKLNIQFDWWKLLHSPQLNTLIDQAFNAHPTVEAAQATLLKTQLNDAALAGYFHDYVNVADAADHPTLILNTSNPSSGKFIRTAYFDLRTHQVSVGYLPDLLKMHETPASSTAEFELRRLNLEGTYLTLSSNLIACLIQDASLRTQMISARKISAIDQSLLAIARKRLKANLVTQAQFLTFQTNAESSAQAMFALKTQFEQTRELLRLMLDMPTLAELPDSFDLTALHLASDLPQELSATLLAQRPDVRAALLDSQIANTKYQSALDTGVRNVQDVSQAIYNDTLALKAASASAREFQLALTGVPKHTSHNVNYPDALTAERNMQLAALRLAQTRAQNLGNAVALYHALGGAWWKDSIALEMADELKPSRPSR